MPELAFFMIFFSSTVIPIIIVILNLIAFITYDDRSDVAPLMMFQTFVSFFIFLEYFIFYHKPVFLVDLDAMKD